MKILTPALCAVFGLALIVPVPAHAQTTYEITIELDDAIAADNGLLNAAALAAPTGEVTQPIRKLAAGVLLEVQLLLQQRLTNGLLTLDDGLQVALFDGDVIKAKMAKKCVGETCDERLNGAVLFPVPGIPANGTPTYILIYKDGECTRSLTFGSSGPPTVEVGCW